MTSLIKKIAPITVILLCILTAIPAQGGLTAKTPSFSVGDHWNYGDVGVTTEDVKMSVTSTTVTYNGATCVEQKVQVYSAGIWMNTSMYYRASDGAMAGAFTDMSTMGMTLKMTMISKPITSQYNFPLTVGKTWRVKFVQQTTTEMSFMGYNTKTTTNDTYDWNFTVVAEEKVTVTAGTFDTLKITSSTGQEEASIAWYAPKAGNMVKSQDSNGGNATELKSYTFKNAPSGGGGGNNDNGGLLGGMMLYIIIIVIVVVVIVVAVAVMMKKKGAPVQPGMVQPAAQPGQPVAPGMQPVAPPVQQPQYQPPAQVQQPQYQPPAQPVYDPNQPYTPPPQAQQYAPQQQYAPPPQAPQQYPPQPPQY